MPCTLRAVLRRLFPFSRGLFEDKVANIWLVADIAFKLRARFDAGTLVRIRCAAVAARCGVLKSALGWRVTARQHTRDARAARARGGKPRAAPVRVRGRDLQSRIAVRIRNCIRELARRYSHRRLLLSLFNSSMAYFLASYQGAQRVPARVPARARQRLDPLPPIHTHAPPPPPPPPPARAVHEKAILMPMLPLTMLIGDIPLFSAWFGAFATCTCANAFANASLYLCLQARRALARAFANAYASLYLSS